MNTELIFCPHCGAEMPVGSHSSYICPHCGETVERCHDCGKWCKEEDLTYTAEGYVCETCLEDFEWCERCEDYHRADGFETVRVGWRHTEQRWCEACTAAGATRCEYCEEYVEDDYRRYVDDYGYVCESCIEDSFMWCDRCERYVHEDDWDWDYECCSDCADSGCVQGYHANHGSWSRFGDCRPQWRGKWRGIGIELEIDKEEPDSGLEAELVEELQNIAGGHIYFERDGSLRHGFEIITQPHTVDAFWQIDWSRILGACKRYGYTSHDAETCGLHVHVSNEMFGPNERAQATSVAKLLAFYNNNYEQIVNASRRTEYTARQWAAPYDNVRDRKTAAEQVKNKGWAGRYHAINLTNAHTIEVRIMRGTLKLESFRACIDFVTTTARNARRIRWDEVDRLDKWLDGIEPATLDYLKERGAFVCV